MKISKLFHWLYAILMLLPLFAILSTILYTTFNKNAYQSYYGNTINEEQLTKVNTDTLTLNENYTIDKTLIPNNSITTRIYFNATNIYGNFNNSDFNYTEGRIEIFDSGDSFILRIKDITNTETYINTNGIIVVNYTFTNWVQQLNVNNFDAIYLRTYNNLSYLSDSFYYAVDKVENSPLFSWAYDSFLTAPFSYIVNLFGMPTNHVIVELLSYWLAISIIWLVFDLVMYVPLLVHRWLDKGVLE